MAVTTDALVYEWVGKKADDDGTEHANADADKATWFGNVGSLNITLSNFDWSGTDGWAGAGTAGNPYALIADGSGHLVRSTTATGAAWQDTSFSMEQWICPLAWVPGDTGGFFTNKGAAGYGFRYYTSSTENSVSLRWGPDGAADTYFTVKSAFTPGTWYHVVLTYNGTNLYTYWDNAQTSHGAVTYSPNTTIAVAPFFTPDTTSNVSNGSIATTRWYSKALSVAEVAANYAAGVLAASTDAEPTFTGLTVTRPVG